MRSHAVMGAILLIAAALTGRAPTSLADSVTVYPSAEALFGNLPADPWQAPPTGERGVRGVADAPAPSIDELLQGLPPDPWKLDERTAPPADMRPGEHQKNRPPRVVGKEAQAAESELQRLVASLPPRTMIKMMNHAEKLGIPVPEFIRQRVHADPAMMKREILRFLDELALAARESPEATPASRRVLREIEGNTGLHYDRLVTQAAGILKIYLMMPQG